jgi:uncharacterized protein
MRPAELTPPEQRVFGCLIEKRWTTPDQYPLSVNGLRLACNQATNRDPVTAYDEATIRGAAQRLCRYGLARLASGHTSRSIKYRHLAEEALGLDRQALALLGVLLLRGPQTPGELKGRSDRMAPFDSLTQVDSALSALAERGYVANLGRRPGQKEDRFMHRLGAQESGASSEQAMSTGPAAGAPAAIAAAASDSNGPPAPDANGAAAPDANAPPATADLEARVAALEAETGSLHEELTALREGFDALRAQPVARFER